MVRNRERNNFTLLFPYSQTPLLHSWPFYLLSDPQVGEDEWGMGGCDQSITAPVSLSVCWMSQVSVRLLHVKSSQERGLGYWLKAEKGKQSKAKKYYSLGKFYGYFYSYKFFQWLKNEYSKRSISRKLMKLCCSISYFREGSWECCFCPSKMKINICQFSYILL